MAAPPTSSVVAPTVSEPMLPPAASGETAALAEGECEAGDVLIYLLTGSYELYGYDPDAQELTLRGALDCGVVGFTPYSMAVNRFGIAYVLYQDGQMYRVDTRDLSCEATPFVPGVESFRLFGMGFVRNQDSALDELFVTDIGPGPSAGLARIDVENWMLGPVGAYPQDVGQMELTGSSDGQLYGYAADMEFGGRILHIDKTNAGILNEVPLSVGAGASSLAFAFFRDKYYIFSGDSITTQVHRYDPSAALLDSLATIDRAIVGAGVSTCDL